MFNVGDKVRRVSYVDFAGDRPSNGHVWEVYCVEYDGTVNATYLGFALDPVEPNKATWDAACFELVEQYSPNEAKPPEVIALGDKLSLTDWADKQYQIWCDTCEGSGEIDETLGSIAPYGDPHAKCPDCDGKGFWLKSFETKYEEPIEEKPYSTTVEDTFCEAGIVRIIDNLQINGVAATEWTDKHYDAFYHLTPKDIERGFVKVDPYFVAKQWKIGSKDDSGALWHCFKAIARFGEKNTREREIKALYAQVKRLAELEDIEL